MPILSLTSRDYHARLLLAPSLVVFTTPGCGACRHVKALLDPLAEALGLALFEVDAGREGGLVGALDVFHLPAVFLYLGGQYHAAILAEATPTALRAAIARARAAPPEEEP